MNLKLYLFLHSIFVPLLLFGQSSTLKEQEIIVAQFSIEEGLSQSMSTMVFRDETEIAWIGTGGGLHSFDGNKFTIFKNQPDNHHSIPDNIIRDMLPLGKGKYILTTSSAISIFDKNKNQFTHLVKTKQSEPVSLKINRNGKFLFWSRDHGYFWVRENEITPIQQHLKKGQIENSKFVPNQAIEITSDKILVAGNQNFIELLFQNDTKVEIAEYSFPIKGQLHIAKGELEKIFLTGNNKVFEYIDKGEVKPSFSSPVQSTSTFFIDKEGSFWQASAIDNKLYKRNSQGTWTELSLFIKEGKLSEKLSPFIKFISEDKNDCIWIGTDGNGILLYQPRSFDFQKSEIGFTTSISSTEKYIWAGTWQNGLFRFLPQFGKKEKIITPSISEREYILHLTNDTQNRIWIMTENKLSVLTENGQEIFSHFLKANRARIWKIAYDTILISVPGNIYTYSYTKNKIELISHEKSLFISDLLKTNEGYWMCNHDGIFLNKVPIASETNKISNTPSHRILKIKDEIWISGNNGILVFSEKGTEKRHYEYPTHLPDTKLYGMLHDEKNNEIWFSTEKGISKMNIQTEQIHSFGKEHNLQSLEFNSSAFHQTRHGQFIYGGIKGINAFFPEEFYKYSKSKKKYTPILTALTIRKTIKEKTSEKNNNTSTSTISLPYINVGFYGRVGIGDYEKSTLQELSLFMENYDQEWNAQENTMNFSFGRLSPGNYILKAKYKNAYGNWSEPVDILSINVALPFWLTTWFITISILIFLTLLILLLKYFQAIKLKKVIEKLKHKNLINQERLRIARDLHDEIGTELSQISLLAQKNTKNDELANIAEKTQTLIENLKYVIWIADPEYDSLDDMQAIIREYIVEFSEKASWKYSFEKWENDSSFEIDSLSKRNLFLIIKECLHNSLKHSGSDSIFLSWEYISGKLHFLYADNGCGITEKNIKNKGRGIKNIKKRAEESKGFLQVMNHPNYKGFCVKLILPVNKIPTIIHKK